MHLKRQKAPKSWPIPRKGTSYVVRPTHDLNNGIPVLIVLRDMLKLTQNKKETKKAIHAGLVLLNNKKIKDERNSISLFDVLSIVPSKEYYRLVLTTKGKFGLEKIDEKEKEHKIIKIINKKTLKGKKTQLNLSDGRNFLSDLKCKTNDSILLNLKENKIEKCLPFNEKAEAIIFGGKHSGKNGKINKIDLKNKIVELTYGKEKLHVLIKHLMVAK